MKRLLNLLIILFMTALIMFPVHYLSATPVSNEDYQIVQTDSTVEEGASTTAAGESHSNATEAESGHGSDHESEGLNVLWAIPFVLILLSIALFPLFAEKFWHHNYWKISLFIFCVPMAIVGLFFLGEEIRHMVYHETQSYISFILLLASLFTISGGIRLKGTLVGKPGVNVVILAVGTVLASFMATTGASMLLIRPLIRANKNRKTKVHTIIFFIFTVSNIGGLLTPLGDPPLFLGYLRGVPFEWTLFNLVFEWVLMNAVLLVLYFIVDTIIYHKRDKKYMEETEANNKEEEVVKEKLGIEGGIQFVFLLGVVLSIYFQGLFSRILDWWPGFGPQEIAMFLMMLLSLVVAPSKSEVRKRNEFTWFPIKEVAALFAGIFACMIPALRLLQIHGPTMGVEEPFQFFWYTGILSSFLDNAPTYLVFLELGQSVIGSTLPSGTATIADVVAQHDILAAISCGAVFMGANSYIGNAPNFMVRSIAEESGIKMPSFFGYMLYSLVILIPLFILVTYIFFL